jgi:hypothetical protein
MHVLCIEVRVERQVRQLQPQCSVNAILNLHAPFSNGISATAAVLHMARQHVITYPSVAVDAIDNPLRNATYLLQRTVNSIHSTMEISDQQAAFTCLGHNADQASHQTWNVYVGAAVTYVNGILPAQEEDDAPGHSQAGLAFGWPEVPDDMVRDGAEDSDEAEGSAEVYVDASDVAHACAQHEHYARRGAELEEMNLYEYAGVRRRATDV